MTGVRLTIGIATRNRPEALARCLRSLEAVKHLAPEVIVFDDESDVPIDEQLAGMAFPFPIRVLRQKGVGMIVGRNRVVEKARVRQCSCSMTRRSSGPEAVENALDVLDTDPRVAAVGFAQSDRHGTRWDDGMRRAQPDACHVPSFIGFAHMVRLTCSRDRRLPRNLLLLRRGKEVCLRIRRRLHAIYLPMRS